MEYYKRRVWLVDAEDEDFETAVDLLRGRIYGYFPLEDDRTQNILSCQTVVNNSNGNYQLLATIMYEYLE